MAAKPERWDLEVDLVAVGSGLAALTPAIVAHDLGAKVCVLEKAPKLGGVSAYGAGEVFVPANHKMREAGNEDSLEAGRAYLEFLSAGFADPELLDTLAEVQFLLGQDAQAVATGEEALALAPDQPYYREQLRRFLGERPRGDRKNFAARTIPVSISSTR